MYYEPLTIQKCAQRRKRKARRGLIRKILQNVLAGLLVMVFSGGFGILFLDAAERESAWQKDRLCRIYGVCDPKAGP